MIVVRDIAYVRYQAPDLDVVERFFLDFGLQRAARTGQTLYMSGFGEAPYLHVTELGETSATLGFGLLAQSMGDLEKLAAMFGKEIEPNPGIGGGHRVRLTDPGGFIVDVIYGQQSMTARPHRDSIDMNTIHNRQRRGQGIRLEPKPSCIMRLGHVALLVPDFEKSFNFYHNVLGMRASDSYYAGASENTIAAFMRCGLGDTFTDHHTIALIQAPDGLARFEHSAFEVLDLDDVAQGNTYLKERSHKHSWGIGRHIQGSQIFDYWRDPYHNKVEHWTDGDLVNDATPVGHTHISNDDLAQWAPPFNPEFFS